MTLVTEGGREMNIEEKKEWLKARKDRIKLNFECGGIDCGYCPFLGLCVTDKEAHDLSEEVWAEENGYVKKEDSVENPDHIEATKKSEDPVNPDHYKAGKLQTIEQMMIVFGPNKVAGFCEVNAFKYHARAGLKGDAVMDHKKADWYMRLYERLSKYSSGQTDKALEEVRKFLKEEEENDRLRNKHERDNCECAG